MAHLYPQVGVTLLPVPDGTKPKDAKRLRLSISVSPTTDDAAKAPFDLREWPTLVAKRTQQIRVYAGKVSGPENARRIENPTLIATVSPDQNLTQEQRARDLWRRIFVPSKDSTEYLFERLHQALKVGTTTAPRNPLQSSLPAAYGTYHTADLAAVVDSLYASAAATSLIARASTLAGQAERSTDLPSAWWRALGRDWFGVDRHGAIANVRAAVREEMRLAGAIRTTSDELTAVAVARLQLGANGDDCGDGGTDAVAFAEAATAALADDAEADAVRTTVVRQHLAICADTLASCAGNTEYWRGAVPAIPPAAAMTLQQQLATFEECWAFDQGTTAEAPRDFDPNEDAGRKFAAILSHPTVAKYLGLIVDIEIGWDALEEHTDAGDGHHFGAISVELAGNGAEVLPHTERVWTTFVYRPGSDGYFGPCPRRQSVEKNIKDEDAIKDGLLDLTVKEKGTPRFSVTSVDVTAAIMSLRQQAMDRARRPEPDVEERRLPELRSRGFTLVDRFRTSRDSDEKSFRSSRKIRETPNTFLIRDAEDLFRGYRIDVGVGRMKDDAAWTNPDRWRSLMYRDLKYGNEDVPTEFQEANPAYRDRNDGFAQPTTAKNATDSFNLQAPYQEVFSWGGESLAVQALRKPLVPVCDGDDPEERNTFPDPYRDLAINLDIDLPSEPGRRIPPLRYKRGYVFGARACYVNGCGLGLDGAIARYTDPQKAPVLGSGPREPIIYRRIEEVQAPEVLLPWDDRVVTSPAVRRPVAGADVPTELPTLTKARGETIEHLVVRSGTATQTPLTRRFLMPPRSTFDLCEQSGEFDDRNKRPVNPVGAFVGAIKVRFEPGGQFPAATGPVTKGINRTPGRSRGSVLELDGSAPVSAEPYHVDPLAGALHARFARDGEGAAGFDKLSTPVRFWSQEQSSQEACPVVLDLEPVPKGSARGRLAGDSIRVKPKKGRLPRDLNRLRVQLAPAEVVDLEVWSAVKEDDAPSLAAISNAVSTLNAQVSTVFDPKTLEADPPKTDGQASKEGQSRKQFDDLLTHLKSNDPIKHQAALGQMLSAGPMSLVTTARVVRLVHAVDKPIDAPEVRLLDKVADLHAVVLTIPASNGVDLAPGRRLKNFADYVAEQQKATKPHKDWPSQKDGNTTFLVGTATVHRPSTGRLRCEARWYDYGPRSLRWVEGQQEWIRETPKQLATFTTVEEIDPEYEPRKNGFPLSFLKNDQDEFRPLFHSFPDGRARKLEVTLIGTSRFTEYFEPTTALTAEQQENGTEHPYERHSKPIEVWTKATLPPEPPVIDRVLPVFHFDSTCDRQHREVEFIRKVSARVYLKVPWYTAGECEKLAVLFSARTAAQKPAETTLDDNHFDTEEVRPFRDLLTRWGADPIHVSGSPGHLIHPSQFGAPSTTPEWPAPVLVPGLKLTLPPPPDAEQPTSPNAVNAITSLDVTIQAYEPQMVHAGKKVNHSDDANGPMACTIAIDSEAVYFPFVQLGLARYQEHAVDELRLSKPVSTWFQIPPVRKGTIAYGSDRSVILTLHGVGFHNPSGDSRVARPLLNVRMLAATRQDRLPRDGDGSRAWQRAVERGRTVEDLGRPPDIVKPSRPNGPDECWWIVTLRMPQSQPGVRYALLIEEVERMPQDFMQDNAESGKRFYEEIVDRSPLFSHIVDLGE